MIDRLEENLRILLAEDADRAPDASHLAEDARQWQRRRRNRRAVIGLAAAVVAVAITATAATTDRLDDPSTSGGPSAASPRPGTAAPAARSGALPGTSSESCVEAYSPEALAARSFAFDGTVSAIEPARTDSTGADLELASVTFSVDAWYRGGTGPTATIDLTPAQLLLGEDTPTYDIGTRLLVSGEPRWGGNDPLADAIAWGCGFTRYHDEATAEQWRAAFDT